MADWKPSAKSAVVTPATTDIHAVEQGGNIYKETNAQILGLLSSTGLDSIKVDTIAEKTATSGVTIDGLLIKDGYPQSSSLPIAGFLDDGTPFFRKRVQMGDWNMDGYPNLNVTHSITSGKTKIISVPLAFVRPDNDSGYINLSYNNNGYIFSFDDTYVTLARLASGVFDSTSYDSTSFNRGYVIIDYIL